MDEEEILNVEDAEALFDEIVSEPDGDADNLLENENADNSEVDGLNDANNASNGDNTEQQTNGDGQEADVWASVPETARSQFEALQQRYKQLEHAESSNRNRVSALQRKLDQLSAQPPEPQKPEEPKELSPELKEAMELYGTDDIGLVINHLVEQQLAERLTPLQQQYSQFQEQLTPVIQERERAEHERQQAEHQRRLDDLSTQHNDVQDVQRDPNFWAWVDLSGQRQQMAESPDPAVVANLLSDYKRTHHKPQEQPPQQQQSKRDLSRHASLKKAASRKADNLGGEVDDPEAYFNSI